MLLSGFVVFRPLVRRVGVYFSATFDVISRRLLVLVLFRARVFPVHANEISKKQTVLPELAHLYQSMTRYDVGGRVTDCDVEVAKKISSMYRARS